MLFQSLSNKLFNVQLYSGTQRSTGYFQEAHRRQQALEKQGLVKGL